MVKYRVLEVYDEFHVQYLNKEGYWRTIRSWGGRDQAIAYAKSLDQPKVIWESDQ